MNDEVRSLLEALRRGKFEDPEGAIELLAAALQEVGGAPLDFLLPLLGAPQAIVRRAAVLGCKGRREPAVRDALRPLAEDPDERVRQALASALAPLPDKSFLPVLLQLCRDPKEEVRIAALRSGSGDPAFQEVQSELLLKDKNWAVRTAAAEALSRQTVPQVLPALFQGLAKDSDDDVRQHCAQALEKWFTEKPQLASKKAPEEIHLLEKAEKALVEEDASRFPRLLAFIQSRTAGQISPEELAQFGTNLSLAAQNGSLPKAFLLDSVTERLVSVLTGSRRRSVVVLGEPGVGKTSLVHDLTHQLSRPERGGWHILRMSPADFVVGTTYIGEWETRVANLIKAVKHPRRVILYIPNFGELSGVGKHSKSDHNVLTALLPHIQDGSLLLLGESTASEFETGFQKMPQARAAFEQFILEEPSVETTRDLLGLLRDQAQSTLSDAQLDQVVELAGQFLVNHVRPGNAARLFQSVHALEAGGQSPPTTRLILEALSTSTGLPVDLLDDGVPLDPQAARGFFETRVLGQSEAIEAMLDLITLIKAGLTDPQKPMGVFLFVGPTGVGKTELARALAEYIFSDARRLVRFDMSEFADSDGFQRLIDPSRRGSLTDAVRRNPFSVVLLDEIEKSHVNVFDLCLQLFDAGRLTDPSGRTTDFRRSILVLTSNVGSSKPVFSPIGFKSPPSAVPEEGRENTLRELSHFFRPEFLNRIDRIVYFRPLGLDVAENIARKEVARVLARGGITRRNLVVEVDPAAISLLVREGYSPHFGARPLKRAVERSLLIPVARVIASGKIQDQSILRLTEVNGKIQPHLIRSAPGQPSARVSKVTPGTQERIEQLRQHLEGVTVQAAVLGRQKAALLEQTLEPGFYEDATSASAVFHQIHQLDQFLSFFERIRSSVENFLAAAPRIRRTATESGKVLKQLETQLQRAHRIAMARENGGFEDALLQLTLVKAQGEPIGGLRLLWQMFSGFARSCRLGAELLAEDSGEQGGALFATVTGLGACALLRSEAGLHEFLSTGKARTRRTGKETHTHSEELIRVDLLPFTDAPPGTFVSSLKTEVQAARRKPRFLPKAAFDISLFEHTSMRSVHLLLGGARSEALEAASAILYSLIQAAPAAPEQPGTIVRRYELGIGSKARDLRTSATTPHLDKLFKGHLELLE